MRIGRRRLVPAEVERHARRRHRAAAGGLEAGAGRAAAGERGDEKNEGDARVHRRSMSRARRGGNRRRMGATA